ncbi:GNAT family N-acetyltransferase [Phenylobacterium sp.]|uniref:GNAT family N-acetyltransferase n=1 Tax=Phenylobacterium sp. TaxID=1871053 RepID=UPI0025D34F73|nr:GNAT family N-acetyltransferase [Phenylobacterium sp.]
MPEPVIRRAGPADAETLAELGLRTFAETFRHLYAANDFAAYTAKAYALDRIAADLADPASAMWLVEADGQAIGYALAGPCILPHAEVTPGCGELKRIYFTRDRQGGGIGRRLFGAVMGWLQADGPRAVWIGVWSGNHGALRFYEREGFVKAGEYDFLVGKTIDLEFILRRPAESFAAESSQSTARGHNFA